MIRAGSTLPAGPSWFLTLSPADLQWPENFQAILPNLTLEDATKLSFRNRIRMVNEHPYKIATMFWER